MQRNQQSKTEEVPGCDKEGVVFRQTSKQKLSKEDVLTGPKLLRHESKDGVMRRERERGRPAEMGTPNQPLRLCYKQERETQWGHWGRRVGCFEVFFSKDLY